MSESAVATPASAGEGAASESQSPSVLGFDSQGALLDAMGLPNRDNAERPGKPAPTPSPAKAAPEGEEKGYEFEFGGRVYKGKTEADARAAAEHALSVHRGQAKAASKEAARLRTEIAQLKRGVPQPSAAPAPVAAPAKVAAPAAAPDKAAASEDGNLLGLTSDDVDYVKALRAEGKHDQADTYLALKYEQALKDVRGRTKSDIAAAKAELMREFDALRKPMQDRAARQAQFDATVEAFRNRADLLDDDGEAVYPELKEDAALDEITDTWNRMVSPVADYPALPPEFATTPAGAHVAYAVWFLETYAPLVRTALAEGYGGASATPAPAHAKRVRGTLTAPVALPSPAPRREAAPRPPGSSIKDMLTSRNEDNLI